MRAVKARRLCHVIFTVHSIMIPDLDIYRAANVLVKRHGQDAPIEAAMGAGPVDGERVH